MEKRVVLLVVLCMAVFIGWSLLMKAIYPPQPPGPPPPPAAGKPVQGPAPEAPPKPEPAKVLSTEPVQASRLKNENIEVNLTNVGAGITDAAITIKGHEKPISLLRPFAKDVPHFGLQAEGVDVDLLKSTWKVDKEEPGRSVTYLLSLGNDLVIEKRFTLEPGRYEVNFLVTIRNPKPASPRKIRLRMTALTGLEHDSAYRYDYYGNGFFTTVVGGVHAMQTVAYDAPVGAGKPVETRVPDSEKGTRRVSWFGLRNRYAAAIVRTPVDIEWIDSVAFQATTQETGPAGNLKAMAVGATFTEFTVGVQPPVGIFSLYLGPVHREELAAVPGAADHLLSYGCWGYFNWIGQAILWMINAAYLATRNYGWAIVLTTLAIRLMLFPLSKKSQTSMARMQELAPKMALLRERYPDDPQKLNAETMKMWKENGVNPLSGCFPLLLQMPIFIGLYNVLDISIEFRQAPFVSWIRDLSQPDKLIPFSSPVSLLVMTITEFNLLPLIMTATWFLQAYMQPRSEDPKMAAQQRMMLFMPVVFGLFCYPLASGLSLYFFVNSLLSMAEMKIIKRFFLPRKGVTPAPAKA